MLMRKWYVIGLLAGAALVAGCGKGGDAPTASVPAAEGSADAQATKTVEPEVVVGQFLDSLRNGNDTLAASLLSAKARTETQAKGLKVQPPGTPDMTYQLGQTEYVTEAKDGAHVGSIWTEKLADGTTDNFEVIWVLRKETEGWRIVGMATPVGENAEPMFLNFEDPDDLLQKWQASEAEVAGATEPDGSTVAPGAANEVVDPAVRPTAGPANGPTQLAPRQTNPGKFVPRDERLENANVDINGNPLR